MKTKGQALVEMAIVILLLFLLVFGIFQFGWLMYLKNTLNNAARAAVRVAVVTPALNDEDYANFSARDGSDQVQQKIYDSLHYINNKGAVSGNIRVTDTSGAQQNPAAAGNTVTVNVTLSNVQSFIPGFINTPNTLSGHASMRYE